MIVVSEEFDRLDPELKEILTKMCEWIGLTPDNVPWNEKDWYTTYSWTIEQQKGFEEWLVDFWHKKMPQRSKEWLQTQASMMMLMWGWKFAD